MIVINYPNFKDDCDRIFGKYLKKYSFEELPFDPDSHEVVYENPYWKIIISMVTQFPHIGVSFDFDSQNGQKTKRSILNKAIGINFKDISKDYNKFSKDHNMDEYAAEMEIAVSILELYYKPLLTGQFKYSDYLQYIIENER